MQEDHVKGTREVGHEEGAKVSQKLASFQSLSDTGGKKKFHQPPITYYWTVPVILDHSYLVGKLKSSKIADTKVSGF